MTAIIVGSAAILPITRTGATARCRALELGKCSLLDEPAVVEDEDAIEAPREVGAAQRPDDRAPFRPLQHGVQHSRLRRRIETGRRLVEHQDVGILDERPGDGEALPLRVGKARSAVADLVLETEPHELGVHPDLDRHLAHERVDPRLRIRVLERDPPEQDVVLDRKRRS